MATTNASAAINVPRVRDLLDIIKKSKEKAIESAVGELEQILLALRVSNEQSASGGTSRPTSSSDRVGESGPSNASSLSNTRTVPVSTSASATDSSDDVSHQGLNKKRHTWILSSPENMFDGSQLSDKRYSDESFRITNELCKWLKGKATEYRSLSDMEIEAFEDSTKCVNGKPRHRIRPISGLKKIAEVVNEHRVAIPGFAVDQLKWMLDYRCAKTAACMRDPSRDKEVDAAHEHFNDVVREVYKVLRCLSFGKHTARIAAHTRVTDASVDTNPGASTAADTSSSSVRPAGHTSASSNSSTSSSSATSGLAIATKCETRTGTPKRTTSAVADGQEDYLSKANRFTGHSLGPAWKPKATVAEDLRSTYAETSDVNYIMPGDIRLKSINCRARIKKLLRFLVERARPYEDVDMSCSLRLLEEWSKSFQDNDWRSKLCRSSEMVDMAEVLLVGSESIDPDFLEGMKDLLGWQKTVTHFFCNQPVRLDSNLAADNRDRRNFDKMLFQVVAILHQLPWMKLVDGSYVDCVKPAN